MISHIHKCIFIHIPKCGGTSIEDKIWPGERTPADLWMGFITKYNNPYQTGGLQHLFGTQIRNEVGESVFNSYFKFSIVRNCWDKAVSQYFYMYRRPDLREFIGMKEKDTFAKYLELISKKTHVQWEPQYKFLTDENGKLLADFLGRLENMNNDAEYIFTKLGIDAKIEHTNKTNHEHYSAYYNKETQEIVGEMYKKDIELLGYTFEGKS